ncbi:hypothetical protein [Candidatus Palauibacter sp.]|uniref:hypothetical protein n=1 Tax=Candidatus Palauibacter sp. TaxID=3101350 RepID=UPI003CC580A7
MIDLVEELERYLSGETIGESSDPGRLAILAREAVKVPGATGAVLAEELLRIFGAGTLADLTLRPRSSAALSLSHSQAGAPRDPPQFNYDFVMTAENLDCNFHLRDDAPIRLERPSLPTLARHERRERLE